MVTITTNLRVILQSWLPMICRLINLLSRETGLGVASRETSLVLPVLREKSVFFPQCFERNSFPPHAVLREKLISSETCFREKWVSLLLPEKAVSFCQCFERINFFLPPVLREELVSSKPAFVRNSLNSYVDEGPDNEE